MAGVGTFMVYTKSVDAHVGMGMYQIPFEKIII